MDFVYENNQKHDEKESDAEIQQQNKNESSALSKITGNESSTVIKASL